MPDLAYDIKDLVRAFRRRGKEPVYANNGIDLKVERGIIQGIFGPNGAGKTTLIRQMVGLLWPTSGEIRLFGVDVVAAPEVIPRRVGYFGQRLSHILAYTPVEFLQLTGGLRGMHSRAALQQARELLDMMGLGDRADRMLYTFSGGEMRIVSVLTALMGKMPVIVLDEPTAELDPIMRQRVRDLLFSYNRGCGATIILVTHNVLEAEKVVDRVAIVDQGRIVAEGSPPDLLKAFGNEVRLELRLSSAAAINATEIPGWTRVRREFFARPAPRPEATRILYEVTGMLSKDSIEDVRLVSPTLEDYYMKAVGKEWK